MVSLSRFHGGELELMADGWSGVEPTRPQVLFLLIRLNGLLRQLTNHGVRGGGRSRTAERERLGQVTTMDF